MYLFSEFYALSEVELIPSPNLMQMLLSKTIYLKHQKKNVQQE